MSQPVLDLNTLHLADGTSKQFSVSYAAADTGTEPAICALPPYIPLEYQLPVVADLAQSCKFTFPPTTVIPPLYNPPIIIPPACENFTAHVDIQTEKSTKRSHLYVTPASVPDCGFDLTGLIAIDACETFKASVNLTTDAVLSGSTLSIVSNSNPACGFVLNADLRAVNLGGCSEVVIQEEVSGGSWELRKPDSTIIGTIDLRPSVEIVQCPHPFESPCCKKVTLSMANGSITIPTGGGGGGSTKADKTPAPVKDACSSWGSDDLLHLDSTEEVVEGENITTISLSGALPMPCFDCDPAAVHGDFTYTHLDLDYLDVKYINPAPCCAENRGNYIDMCDGGIYFFSSDAAQTGTFEFSGLEFKSDSDIASLVASLLTLSDSGDQLSASPSQLYLSDAEGSSAGMTSRLTKEELSVTDGTGNVWASLKADTFAMMGNMSSEFSMDPQELLYTFMSDSWTSLKYNYFGIQGTANNLAELTSTELKFTGESGDTSTLSNAELYIEDATGAWIDIKPDYIETSAADGGALELDSSHLKLTDATDSLEMTTTDIVRASDSAHVMFVAEGLNKGDLMQWDGDRKWEVDYLNAQDGDMLYFYGGEWMTFSKGGNNDIMVYGQDAPYWVDLSPEQGDIMMFDGTEWSTISAGGNNDILVYGATEPYWVDLGASQGDIMYFNGSEWSTIAAGQDGGLLSVAGSEPYWIDAAQDGGLLTGSGGNPYWIAQGSDTAVLMGGSEPTWTDVNDLYYRDEFILAVHDLFGDDDFVNEVHNLFGDDDFVNEVNQLFGDDEFVAATHNLFGDDDFINEVHQLFGDDDFVMEVHDLFGDDDFVNEVHNLFGDDDFVNEVHNLFGDTEFETAVNDTFGNSAFSDAVRALFVDAAFADQVKEIIGGMTWTITCDDNGNVTATAS